MSDAPDFIPDAQAGAMQQSVASAAPVTPDFIPDNQFKSDEETYGTTGQQAIAGLEGAARGATLGLSDVAETKLGISTPEAIKARQEQNPVTSTLGNIAGGVGLVAATGGLAAPVEGAVLGTEAVEAGEAAAEAAKAAGGSASQIAAAGRTAALAEAGTTRAAAARALGYGAEGAMFGVGQSISDAALGDPDMGAEKILGNIGFGAILGGGLGALSVPLENLYLKPGQLKAPISDAITDVADKSKEATAIADAISGGPNPESASKEFLDAAQRQNLPIVPGMGSPDPWVQKATDALINGAPTYAGIKTAGEYSEAYGKAVNVLDGIVGEGRYSKAELGNILKSSLSEQIQAENKPISQMYDLIKQNTQEIPLSEKSAPAIARNILNLQEVKVTPNSPAAKLAQQVASELENLKTVDDVKFLRSSLGDRVAPTASAGEKRIASILRDKLTDLEESSIERYATQNAPNDGVKNLIISLIEEKKVANARYRPFIQKVQALSEQLGKGRVYGPQDAINFISDLDPEQITQRLAAKNSSEFISFFEKNFPEQAALMREYQKGVLRDAATKTGVFSPKVLFNKVNSLEPEIQKAIFTPQELGTLQDVETYIKKGFPKNFNPSGTAGMSAFRAFFESPTGAVLANARDFGIDQFIKMAGKLPEAERPNPISMGSEMAEKFNTYSATQKLISKFNDSLVSGAKNIFSNGAIRAGLVIGGLGVSKESSYEDKVNRIRDLATNPGTMINHMSAHTNAISRTLPNVSQGISATAARGVTFLNSKIPPENKFPLSKKSPMPEAQKERFNNYYSIVNSPLSAYAQIKDGTLNGETMEALSAVYPKILLEMQKAISLNLGDKADDLPYATKIALGKFLGTPLDESMTAGMIAKNQSAMLMPTQSNQMPIRSTQKGMEKLKASKLAATETQDVEEDDV